MSFQISQIRLQIDLIAECNMKNECFREIAGGAMKVKSQRPLAPSNLRGGANMQWGKGIARISGQNFLIMKCKRSVLWTDVLLSVSEKILHIFSNLTNFAFAPAGRGWRLPFTQGVALGYGCIGLSGRWCFRDCRIANPTELSVALGYGCIGLSGRWCIAVNKNR